MVDGSAGAWFDWARAAFEAARQLPHGDPVQRRRHGHSFAVELRVPETGRAFPDWRSRMAHLANKLDYQDLNECLSAAADHDIIAWFAAGVGQSALSGWLAAGMRQGAMQDAQGCRYHWFRDRFEASHYLPQVPAGHKCGRMHGHGFEVVLSASATHDRMLLHGAWQRLRERLHEHCLNDLAGLEMPTSEVLASWIWHQLALQDVPLSLVEVFETASCGSSYDGTRHRVWKRRSFDSALWQNGRRGGHTYELTLGLSANMDETMGWIMDFGDIKRLFEPVYQRLDHHPLHASGATSVRSALQGILEQTGPLMPALDRVDLLETPNSGVIWSRDSGVTGPVR